MKYLIIKQGNNEIGIFDRVENLIENILKENNTLEVSQIFNTLDRGMVFVENQETGEMIYYECFLFEENVFCRLHLGE